MKEQLVRIAVMLTILRDDLEEQKLDKELAQKANSFLKLINKRLNNIHGDNKSANDTLILISQVIESTLKEIGL